MILFFLSFVLLALMIWGIFTFGKNLTLNQFRLIVQVVGCLVISGGVLFVISVLF